MKTLIMTTAMILALAGLAAAEGQEVASNSPAAAENCRQIDGAKSLADYAAKFGPATDFNRPGENQIYKQAGWPTKGVYVAYDRAGLIVSSSCNRFKSEAI